MADTPLLRGVFSAVENGTLRLDMLLMLDIAQSHEFGFESDGGQVSKGRDRRQRELWVLYADGSI